MTPADRAKLLAKKAAGDAYVLVALRDDPAASDWVWGFHAQQAVEKLLKALLAGERVRFGFTHHLLELANLTKNSRHPLPVQFEPLLDLTPYAAELRYTELASQTNSPPIDRRAILTLIQQLVEWVDLALPP
jgi:HEPN domain-containing protein